MHKMADSLTQARLIRQHSADTVFSVDQGNSTPGVVNSFLFFLKARQWSVVYPIARAIIAKKMNENTPWCTLSKAGCLQACHQSLKCYTITVSCFLSMTTGRHFWLRKGLRSKAVMTWAWYHARVVKISRVIWKGRQGSCWRTTNFRLAPRQVEMKRYACSPNYFHFEGNPPPHLPVAFTAKTLWETLLANSSATIKVASLFCRLKRYKASTIFTIEWIRVKLWSIMLPCWLL